MVSRTVLEERSTGKDVRVAEEAAPQLLSHRQDARYRRLPRWLNPSALHTVLYLTADLTALVLAHIAAVRLVQFFLALPLAALNPSQYHRYYIPFFALILYFLDGYRNAGFRRPERELELGCKAVAFTFLGLAVFNFAVFKTEPVSRYLMLSWLALASLFLLMTRFGLRAVYRLLWNAGIGRRKIILLGSPAGINSYQELLSVQRYRGYELLGWIPESAEVAHAAAETFRVPRLGSPEDWEQIVQELGAEALVIPAARNGDGFLQDILERCKQLGVTVELYSSSLASSYLHCERDELSGCLRFDPQPRWSLLLQHGIKRGLDMAIGLIGSAATLLLTPFIALLLKLDDGGPVFYRSAYLGADGENHYYLKFRSMRIDADQMLATDEKLKAEFQQRHKLRDDPRVTRFGHFLRVTSLDEFPEFFSVLKGDLAFVGPRTIRQEEAVHYGPLLGKLLSVKPGLTGFWQTMGRQTTTYEERVQMDMFYIDHWSIWLDLVIAAQTIWKVLKTEGAY